MTQSGMSDDVFAQFIDQLRRYVRERLVPAEDETIEHDRVPDDILAEMKEMGLFGVTIAEEYGRGRFFNFAIYHFHQGNKLGVASLPFNTLYECGNDG